MGRAMINTTETVKKKDRFLRCLKSNLQKHPTLYFMAVPVFIYYFVFHYLPMYGIIIAFQNFVPARGILGSEWVGFKHFIDFFSDPYFMRVVKNTFALNIYDLIFGFPIPIIFALLLNEITRTKYKKFVQTVTYMPHFISTMVICGLATTFLKSDGVITYIITLFGGEATNYLGKPEAFRSIYTIMNIWQEFGWGSIIYIAALTSVDPVLYEAASIDGANRFQKAVKITLPCISPTIVTLLILRMGKMMTLGFEKIILLYNPLTYDTADVISSYVYRRGLQQFDYSYGAAVGFFNAVINFALLIIANNISKKINNSSIW
ncbi:MAG: ABC transporter permease subunit [Lachnospiraceae bacterium]